MKYPTILAMISSLLCCAAQGAVLTGKVLDRATGVALSGVKITVKTGGGAVIGPTITNGRGEFEMRDVPPGSVDITYSAIGYLLDPTIKKCDVSEPAKTADVVQLFKKAATPEYLRSAADRLVLLAQGDVRKAEEQWKWFESVPIAYSAKATLAQAAVQKDHRLGSSPTYRAFQVVDIAKVQAFERQLDEIKKQPEKARPKIKPDLPDPVVREVLKAAGEATPSMRAQFQTAVDVK
jgi:hypothetical protein